MKYKTLEAFEAQEQRRIAKLQKENEKATQKKLQLQQQKSTIKRQNEILHASVAFDTTLHADMYAVFVKHINRLKKENNQYFKNLGICDTICKKIGLSFIETNNSKFLNALLSSRFDVCYNIIATAHKTQQRHEQNEAKKAQKQQQQIDKISEYYEKILCA